MRADEGAAVAATAKVAEDEAAAVVMPTKAEDEAFVPAPAVATEEDPAAAAAKTADDEVAAAEAAIAKVALQEQAVPGVAAPGVDEVAQLKGSAQPVPAAATEDPTALERPAQASGSETARYSALTEDELYPTVLRWVGEVTGRPAPDPPLDTHAVHTHLKNGVELCALINAIRPGSIKRVEKPMGPFQQRENIARFLTAATELGVEGHSLFLTGDLFDGTNIKQVCHCLFALGRACHSIEGYSGPTLGKPSAKLGKHRQASYKVNTGEGLWGKSASERRASAGSDARLRATSATGPITERYARTSHAPAQAEADPTVPRPS